MRPLMRRAVVEGRTMLVHTGLMQAGSLHSCYGKRWAQAGNQCKCDCDPQFHTSSIAADKTRDQDARIHESVVSGDAVASHNSGIFSQIRRFFLYRQLAGYWRGVYLFDQDDFYLQPLRVYVPLLALLLGPGRGIGGVASSERYVEFRRFNIHTSRDLYRLRLFTLRQRVTWRQLR